MPDSLQALAAFVLAVLPGFLARKAYRVGRPAPELRDGLPGFGDAVALSVVVALIAWPLGGQSLYQHARAGTALTMHEAATYRFALGVLVGPPLLAFVSAEVVDWIVRRRNRERGAARVRSDDEKRLLERVAVGIGTRLASQAPTTWDRVWLSISHSERLVCVRITTKGGREIVGTVAAESRVALSPQPRDVYLEEVLRQAIPKGSEWFPTRYGKGMFVAGSEIESVEFLDEAAVVSAPVTP